MTSRLADLVMLLLLTLTSFALTGCASTTPEARQVVFGATPSSKETNYNVGSLSTLDFQSNELDALTKLNLVAVERAVAELKICYSEEQWSQLETARVNLVNNNSQFLMRAIPKKIDESISWQIDISQLTWRGLMFLSMASQLRNEEGLGIDNEWFVNYVLYNRVASNRRGWVSPYVASGYTDASKFPHAREWVEEHRDRVFGLAFLETQRKLQFLLAHEFAHVLNPLSVQSTGETFDQYRERINKQIKDLEWAADQEALDRMLCLTAHRNDFSYIGAPLSLFNNWVLLMQGARHSLASNTHPIDIARMRNVSEYIIKKMKGLESPERWTEMIEVLEEGIELTHQLEKDGLEKLSNDFNSDGSQVSLKELIVVE